MNASPSACFLLDMYVLDLNMSMGVTKPARKNTRVLHLVVKQVWSYLHAFLLKGLTTKILESTLDVDYICCCKHVLVACTPCYL